MIVRLIPTWAWNNVKPMGGGSSDVLDSNLFGLSTLLNSKMLGLTVRQIHVWLDSVHNWIQEY